MATTGVQRTADSSTTPGPSFYRPELDCLRFFAFFAVFIFHTVPHDAEYYSTHTVRFGAFIRSASRAGSFGVDLFFLLSAYLITDLLLQERERYGRIHLKAFYLRRILRIWPLYFFAIFIAVLLQAIDPNQHFPLVYVVAFVFLVGNWMTSLVSFPGSVMNPLWSVSFEEQFYLFWPAVLSRVKRPRTLLWCSAALVVAAQIGRLALLKFARHSEVAIVTNTLARLDPLAAGAATAVLLREKKLALAMWKRVLCGLGGALAWLFAGYSFAMTVAFMIWGFPLIACGAWLLFISVFESELGPRWCRYLGKISYGLYVFHVLCLYISVRILGGYATNLRQFAAFWLLGLALTILFAALSYRFLESPFLRLKERFAFVKSRPV